MGKEKFSLEFIFKASPAMLYQFFTTPAGLTRWFSDSVDISGNKFTFEWDGAEEVAELEEDEADHRLKFRWEDSEEDEFWEVKFSKSPITNETILEVIDFAEPDELEEQKDFWKEQINQLRGVIGG